MLKSRIDLHERFIESLNKKFTKRAELVNYIADALRIEKEPASRRLSGKVKFSASEIGILAEMLEISLDGLLYQTDTRFIIPLEMHYPKTQSSFDTVVETIEKSVVEHRKLSREHADIGSIFDSLPIEFVIPYPELTKFIYFKWGHFFVGASEFKDYRNWHIPAKLDLLHKEIKEYYRGFNSALYIWDSPTIWNLVNDITYFKQIDILRQEDIEKLKGAIHRMLDDLEITASGEEQRGIILENSVFYVSSVNIGTTATYIMGKSRAVSYFKTFFIHSYASSDPSYCMRSKDWINSMKRISTLISGSGEKERTLFFKEQHRIIDTL